MVVPQTMQNNPWRRHTHPLFLRVAKLLANLLFQNRKLNILKSKILAACQARNQKLANHRWQKSWKYKVKDLSFLSGGAVGATGDPRESKFESCCHWFQGMDKPPHKIRSSTAASSSTAIYKKENSQQQQSKNARATQHNCKRFVKLKNEFQIIQKYLDEVPSCTWTHHYHWTVFSERAHDAMGWQQMDTTVFLCLMQFVMFPVIYTKPWHQRNTSSWHMPWFLFTYLSLLCAT